MTDDELRELVEMQHLVTELEKTAGWQTWKQLCDRRIEAKKREMIAGVPETVEAYRYTAGWIEGAEFVLDASAALDRKIKRARESTAA